MLPVGVLVEFVSTEDTTLRGIVVGYGVVQLHKGRINEPVYLVQVGDQPIRVVFPSCVVK
jgi:hypothetical protein